jgi:hypothetical protein
MRGFVTNILITSAVFSLYKCITVDPGYLATPAGVPDDIETPPGSSLELPIPSKRRPRDYELSRMDDEHSDSIVLRYCTTCSCTQPLRTKHCDDCNRCVRTFDHHCPWIGTCIGEGNRARFLLYLCVEFFAILWLFVNGILRINTHAGEREKIGPLALLILAITVMSIFLLMTGILGIYHAFLACVNLTTWEHSSWWRISYLEGLDKREGSPFSTNSILGNCVVFWSRGSGVDWQMGPQVQVLPSFCESCCDC